MGAGQLQLGKIHRLAGGWVNISRGYFKGFQHGYVNVAEEFHGFQLGWNNYADNLPTTACRSG